MRLRRSKQAEVNYSPLVPSGLIAKTEKGFFMVKSGKRFKFISDRAKESWNLKVVNTTEEALKDIKYVGFIGFRDSCLLRDISNNKLYLISDSKRLLVDDPDTLKKLGFSEKDIIVVSSREISAHKEGGVLIA